MDTRGDSSKASWVPATPVKPHQDPICNYQQENQIFQPSNFVRGQICPEKELCQSTVVTPILHGTGFHESASRNSLTTSQEATTKFSGPTETSVQIFSMDCVDKNMPFCDLLALANAASAKTIASGSNSFVGSTPATQFEDKEAKQGHEKTNQAKDDKQLVNNTDTVVQQREHSSDTVSKQVPEKSKSGQGSDVSLGRNTPAQQKPRRKRYMPKVLREGQTKRTPNVKTQKPVNPNDAPKRKYIRRKETSIPPNTHFVDLTKTDEDAPSKNLTNKTRNIHPDTPSFNLASNKPKTIGRPHKTCKRSLNFGTCSQAGKMFTQLGLPPQLCSSGMDPKQLQDLNYTPAPGNPSDSNCSPDYIGARDVFTKGEQARRMKRGHPSAAGENAYSTNIIGVHHSSSVQAYQASFPVEQYSDDCIPDMHFPAIYKRMRTEKCQNAMEQTTKYSPKVNQGTAFTSESNCMSFAAQCTKPLSFRSMLATGNKETRKKRSRESSTRVRNIASLNEIAESIQSTRSSIMQEVGNSHQPYIHAAKTTKKQTKRKTQASGSYPGAMLSVDALVEHLRYLDINAERGTNPNMSARRYNSARHQEQNALVVYQRDGTLVTMKKRTTRPRVKLDKETTRVWKLLLQDINSEGINGTDKEKEKWWEDERRIFDERANSFIKCMHLIQGDRTFSRWKGSVVDSVVGVFLTQNVSDHRSSSAYMSLASRFPLVLKSNHDPLFKEVLNPDDTVEWQGMKSKQPTLNQRPMMIQEIECNEHRVLNSNESSAQANGERVQTPNTMDSADWEAVRLADVKEVAHTIRDRGMNNVLAERIKEFLDQLVSNHGSIDLEWLRDVPPNKAKEYLLGIKGLGLKSVECVRLLTLHHIAFPVDTNVGRIAVRLGWVPLQPLPESLQLHLLEMYPVLASVQKYLWPRLCKLDQRTLYELHYQMITFGKVFCTKSKPNCNACPLRGECRHFASAFSSARLALPGPEERSIVTSEYNAVNQNPVGNINRVQLPVSLSDQLPEENTQKSHCEPIIEVPASPEPIIEVPATLEPEREQVLEHDIEDFFSEDPENIPTIKLNIEEFTQTIQRHMDLREGDVSKALVALTPEAASIPEVKLKNVARLRTEHQVYELPDTHPLLDRLDRRESDDPSSYLLAIWTPGETADSIKPPTGPCSNQESGSLCSNNNCFECSSTREAQSQTVRGTLLIPCRTAMKGSFPLNGTYFQVNEVFADHASSLRPLEVPRYLLWNLPRKTVYFGTSIHAIFRGMTTRDIQLCFWKGYVCVRGFDRETRAPKPLLARLHFPTSKLSKGKEKKETD